jgi:hypothetical protein
VTARAQSQTRTMGLRSKRPSIRAIWWRSVRRRPTRVPPEMKKRPIQRPISSTSPNSIPRGTLQRNPRKRAPPDWMPEVTQVATPRATRAAMRQSTSQSMWGPLQRPERRAAPKERRFGATKIRFAARTSPRRRMPAQQLARRTRHSLARLRQTALNRLQSVVLRRRLLPIARTILLRSALQRHFPHPARARATTVHLRRDARSRAQSVYAVMTPIANQIPPIHSPSDWPISAGTTTARPSRGARTRRRETVAGASTSRNLPYGAKGVDRSLSST